jgi:LmbE family N-acetylglucosaminyl deacetylase/SAM-dependent methyltransferase
MVTFSHTDGGTEEVAWAASGIAGLRELPLDSGELADMTFILLAAHPDDESLGAGGLLSRLTGASAEVEVLLCSAGEASHPGSPTTTRERLAAARLAEFGAAMSGLGLAGRWQFLELADGKLAQDRAVIALHLKQAVGRHPGPPERLVLVAPYRGDGHIDHDTVGAVAAELAGAGGHGLLEYPIWYWLWAAPEHQAWQNWVRLPLSDGEQRAKRAAMRSHASQVQPLSEHRGDEVLLTKQFLAHFERPFEIFAWQHPVSGRRGAADAEGIFDAVHLGAADPWGYEDSWYEQRKRALTLAALPEPKYDAGLEVGCSIGTLSAGLAQRCGRFLAVDASSTAQLQAARRLAPFAGAEARHLTLPRQWPDGSFDLIVVSEVGYYLTPPEVGELFGRIAAALAPGGTLLLCHWRHPISGWELDGDSVHALARDLLRWPTAGLYRERDFVLETFRAPALQQDPVPAHGT